MDNLIKKKSVFNVEEIRSNKFYRITRKAPAGYNDSIYHCILDEKSEDQLSFRYCFDGTGNKIVMSILTITIEDIESEEYIVEVLE